MKRFWYLMMILLASLAIVGCDEEEEGAVPFDSTYGEGVKSEGRYSVNGTAVFANMFESAGHNVRFSTRLDSRVRSSDVIIWAPDSFLGPNEQERRWFESWIREETGKTLIYIGRDYDGELPYWSKVIRSSSGDTKANAQQRFNQAIIRHEALRQRTPETQELDWFTIDMSRSNRFVRDLTASDSYWLDGIEIDKCEIAIRGEIQHRDFNNSGWKYEDLILAEDTPLLFRMRPLGYQDSSVLVAQNGSFLLNYSLINHEHRKLAGKIIDFCGEDLQVTFVESRQRGPSMGGNPPPSANPNRPDREQRPGFFNLLMTNPLGLILIHLCIAGLIYCFLRFPVFGRARERFTVSTVVDHQHENRDIRNFGRHIDAVGGLLHKTRDTQHAASTIRYYDQHVSND
jgi:hypothetical protein